MKARLASNAEKVRAAALAVLPDLVQQWLPDGDFQGEEYVALNPRRKDVNLGSFRINVRSGKWRDHAIGEGGRDAVSLFAYLFSDDDYSAALKALAGEPCVRAAIATGAKPAAAKPANNAKTSEATLALATRLYSSGTKLRGTPAAAYLRLRGLRANKAWEGLRASRLPYPRLGSRPALLAPVRAVDGALVGLQRTFLNANGTKLDVPAPRLTLGTIHGGAVHLGEAADALIICEGLEDGLALFQELHIPVWVACGAGFMRSIVLPAAVKRLTIAADNDETGERAAYQAADAHQSSGRTVEIIRPSPEFKDFNDQLQGVRS